MLFFHIADSIHGFIEEDHDNSSVSSSQDHAYSCIIQWYQQDRNDHDHIRMRKNIQTGTFVSLSVFLEHDNPVDRSKTIWVEVLATTVVKPTKQQCGNSIGSVLLSPAVLHSLHIYDTNAKVCISNDTCPNPVFKAVHMVTLSRIIGQSYPNDEAECTLLQNYFDIPHRRVDAGDMAVIPAAMVDNHWLVPDVQYYVYVVTQVDIPMDTGNNEADSHHQHQHQQQQLRSTQTVVFNVAARGMTKVVLKGRIHRRLIDSTIIGIYMKFLQWHEKQRRCAHEMNVRTSIAIAIDRDNNKLWGYPAKQIVQMVSPILDTLTEASFPSQPSTHRGGVSEATLGHLLSSPLLVESSFGDDGMKTLCNVAARKLGLNLVVLDARTFLDVSSMVSTKTIDSVQSALSPTQLQTSHSNAGLSMNYHHICKNNVPLHLVQTHAPCLLLLEGLEDMLFGNLINNDQQQASSGNMSSSGGNEPQDKIAKRLMQFCDELGQATMKQANTSYATARSVTTTTTDIASLSSSSSLSGNGISTHPLSRPMIDHAVIVIASCEAIQRLGPSMQAVFHTEIRLDNHTDREREKYVHDLLYQDSDMHHKDTKKDPHNESHDEIDLAQQMIHIGERSSIGRNAPLVSCHAMVEETVFAAMKRSRGSAWMRGLGLGPGPGPEPGLGKGKAQKLRDGKGHMPGQAQDSSLKSNDDLSHDIITIDDIHAATISLLPSGQNASSSNAHNSHISPVHWKDIGGLDHIRKEILTVLHLPSHRPELFPKNALQRRGILLYGPPGTGKTLVARAVATECGMYFISVKGPELLDVFVGESEKNVRDTFANAHQHAPCVLFFDELDSLAPARGRGSDGGGVMDRVVSQLLTEMDTLSHANESTDHQSTSSTNQPTFEDPQYPPKEPKKINPGVFVVGATNRPDLLDPALMRPGRFDRKIYLSVCKDISTRCQILKAQSRKFTLADDVDLTAVATGLPITVTGADLGALTSAAYARALARKLDYLQQLTTNIASATPSTNTTTGPYQSQSKVDTNLHHPAASQKASPSSWAVAVVMDSLPEEELVVQVQQEDFLYAATQVKPSVSIQELMHYESLGSAFSDFS